MAASGPIADSLLLGTLTQKAAIPLTTHKQPQIEAPCHCLKLGAQSLILKRLQYFGRSDVTNESPLYSKRQESFPKPTLRAPNHRLEAERLNVFGGLGEHK